ncbi:prepilin peptidase [Spongiibacter sp. KMU-158]|uniref:Prepilin leader peptidase/N-methyltransferase n=1 Tax=Spongiibacter pelagi TaxID=2760804 RepID=A0A927C4J1_9GAMM|nr:A24 family peptidase [Spongiibacter pelagi]MBD2859752.1 prepilin peptidase [Spongiibacter pelagi]
MTFLEALNQSSTLLYILTAIFSLLFGSFFNVVIYRLPKMMEANWRSECEFLINGEESEPQPADKKFGLAFPHSHCPNCQAPVKPWQNIPVISYLLLKGKCASCKTSIGIRYPAIEIITAAIAVFTVSQFGLSSEALAFTLFGWLLLILTMIDIDHQLLPDSLTLPLLWLGLAWHASFGQIPLQDAVWGAIAGYLTLWSVYWLFKIVTGKEGMGFGDFKLLAALGAWLGWQSLPLIIILSSLVGAVLGSLTLALSKKSQSNPIPFGPYLAIAGWISLFWGAQITENYLRFAGF